MATKTKEAAMKAARKALGPHASEGVDYQLRHTGVGWEHEVIPAANEPAKRARAAKKAPGKRAAPPVVPPADLKHARAVNRSTNKSLPAPPAPKPKAAKKPAPTPGETKTDLIVGMLKRPAGATSKQLEEATGWLPHSVRGLLGTLRQRGTKVLSDKAPGQPTVYRVAAEAEAEDVI